MHTMQSSIIGRYNNTTDSIIRKVISPRYFASPRNCNCQKIAVKLEDLKIYLKSERRLKFSRFSMSPLINLIVFSRRPLTDILKTGTTGPFNSLKNIP